MKNDNFFETFSILSKIIIIIPLATVIIALFLKYSQTPKKNNPNLVLPTPVVTQQPTVKINIDFTGPFVCQSKVEEASLSAFIKDKKVKVIIDEKDKVENILIAGDCFYNWQNNQYSGKRLCGISSFLSAAQTMMNLGVIGVGSFINQLNSLGIDNKIATNQASINQLLNSCLKQPVEDKNFVVPQNVLFRNLK